ncbi:hypothetical protein K504DRAFT_530375 [Pleomassaria siparia CBS 279.74]|uniref:Uncharacterized protein n=1 Tax=Pleomassaria siparia CBS 279.74 TaxID=1314801 RepID=A0A6G1KKM0_9PLEO|nr:hypothetical protein K504DRAFT_530375 [Pleomassaria siparia CBS 279.74]
MVDTIAPTSKTYRALLALPFLALAITSVFCMDVISLIKDFDPPSITGNIEWDDGSFPILKRFHMIPFLDEVFRDVTVGFAPSTFEYDPPTWWQVFSFLNDAGVMYMIMLLESMRPANKRTAIYFPSILGAIAQLGGGGVFIPLYYFLHLIFCPSIGQQTSTDRRVDVTRSFVWLPLMLVFHYYPVFAMYLSEDFATRHYWVWAWQLYCVRIGIGYYVIQVIGKVLPLNLSGLVRKMNYHTSLRLIIGPLIAISAAVWIHMLMNCPYSFSTLFLPIKDPQEGKSWIGMMRRCLQWDEVFVFGGSFLWLAYLAVEMRASKIWSSSSIFGYLSLAGLALGIGPGAVFGVMWLWRETVLVGRDAEDMEMSGKKAT